MDRELLVAPLLISSESAAEAEASLAPLTARSLQFCGRALQAVPEGDWAEQAVMAADLLG